MELETVIALVTFIVSYVLGKITKKTKIPDELIPVQNIAVGVIISIIYWVVTKDFSVAITISGIFAGGTYDLGHNIVKLIKGE